MWATSWLLQNKIKRSVIVFYEWMSHHPWTRLANTYKVLIWWRLQILVNPGFCPFWSGGSHICHLCSISVICSLLIEQNWSDSEFEGDITTILFFFVCRVFSSNWKTKESIPQMSLVVFGDCCFQQNVPRDETGPSQYGWSKQKSWLPSFFFLALHLGDCCSSVKQTWPVSLRIAPNYYTIRVFYLFYFFIQFESWQCR